MRTKRDAVADYDQAASPVRQPSDAVENDRQLLAAIVTASRDAIWSWNADGVVTSWNAEAEHVFGYTSAEIIGQSLLILVPNDRLERACEAIAKLRRGEWYGQYETVRLRKDGTPVEVELTVSPIYGDAGAIIGAATMCRDITQRKQFDETLSRRVNELMALFEFTHDLQQSRCLADVYEAALKAILRALLCQRSAILLFDKGRLHFVAARGLSSAYREAVKGHWPWPTDSGTNPKPICLSDVESADEPGALKAALATEGIRSLARVPLMAESRPIGLFVCYYDARHVFTDDEINVAMTVARQVAIGISQKQDEEARRRAEEELRANEARLRLAVEAAQLGIWDWNLLSGEMIYSARAKEIFGFDADAPVTFANVRDATHPEDRPKTGELLRRARDPAIREKAPYEFRIVRPDGSLRWVVAHGEAVFALVDDGKEEAVRYAGTIQDVTAQKQTADALFQSETRLRLAIEMGRMAVWEYDAGTETLVGSPELNRVLGFPPESTPSVEAIRAGYLDGTREIVREAGQRALAAGEPFFAVEFRYRWPDQSVHWLMLRAELFRRDGKLHRLIGILTDVSHLKHAQEQQAILINELNHRVKNTLATVQSLAVMTLKTKAPAEFAEAFSRRLVALSATHDLLTKSGWEHASLDDVIGVELEPYSGGQITLEPSPARILLAPKAALSLGLIFHELATNAVKHGALSQSGGRLVVKWDRSQVRGRPHLSVVWRESNGPAPKTARTAGFGSRLIAASVTSELAGEIRVNYPPAGFHAEIEVPLETLGT